MRPIECKLTCWIGHKKKRTFRVNLTQTFRHITLLHAVKAAVQTNHPEVKQMKRCKLEVI